MRTTLVDGDLPPPLVLGLVRAHEVAMGLDVPDGPGERASPWLCTLVTPATGPVVVRLGSSAPGLAAVLGCASIVKVTHSARADLVRLRSALGVDVRRVVCTRIASEMLRPDLPPPDHELGPVLARWLHERVPESSPGRRGVTGLGARLRDAVHRVRHLPDLARVLTAELDAENLLAPFSAACEYLPTAVGLRATGRADPVAPLSAAVGSTA